MYSIWKLNKFHFKHCIISRLIMDFRDNIHGIVCVCVRAFMHVRACFNIYTFRYLLHFMQFLYSIFLLLKISQTKFVRIVCYSVLEYLFFAAILYFLLHICMFLFCLFVVFVIRNFDAVWWDVMWSVYFFCGNRLTVFQCVIPMSMKWNSFERNSMHNILFFFFYSFRSREKYVYINF